MAAKKSTRIQRNRVSQNLTQIDKKRMRAQNAEKTRKSSVLFKQKIVMLTWENS